MNKECQKSDHLPSRTKNWDKRTVLVYRHSCGFVWTLIVVIFFVLVCPDTSVAQATSSSLRSLQEKCRPWANFPETKAPIYASINEYRAWLREVERRNPHASWQQIVSFLHRQHQTGDEGLTLPLVGDTFINGPEDGGWDAKNIDTACYANTLTGRTEKNSPYFVMDDLGRLIDVTHIYAGIRSDFNRPKDSWKTDFIRRMNTDWGDHFQNIAMKNTWTLEPYWWSLGIPLPYAKAWNRPDGGFAPKNQLIGDAIAIQAGETFRALGKNPKSWADIILTAIEESTRDEELARDRADILPTEDILAETRKPVDSEEELKEELLDTYRRAEEQRRAELCDPENRSKSKSGNLDPEFDAQPTAARGPGYVDHEDCRPFGPAAKRFSYIVPIEPSTDVAAERTSRRPQGQCAQFKDQIDKAAEQFRAGQIRQAEAATRSALLDVADQSTAVACPEQQKRAATNLDKLQSLTKILDDVKVGLTICDPISLKTLTRNLASAKNKKLVALRSRVERAIPVATSYQSGKTKYLNGDPVGARSDFSRALSLEANANALELQTCVEIDKRLNDNKDRAETLIGEENRITEAVGRCDMAAMDTAKQAYSQVTLKALANLSKKIDGAIPVCHQRARDTQCRSEHGGGYTAGELLADGQFYCRPDRATANAWCTNKHGTGVYAVNITATGSFDCRPNKSWANKWCRQNVRGSGVYAGKIRRDGTFNCFQRRPNTARRPQVQQHRPQVRQRQPQVSVRKPAYDPAAAAAAAAIAGAVIDGIISSQSGGGSGGGCSNPLAPGC